MSAPSSTTRRRGRMPTRRLWRIVFRRARIYLPIVIVLLVAMVAWLPLSPPWLARRIESELLKRTGLPIRVASARVRLAAGEVVLRGLELPATGPGERAFTVREVKLTGPLGELLAGDGGWPGEVEIVSLPPLEFDVRDGRLVERGALATLRRALAHRPARPAPRPLATDDAATSASPFDPLMVRTPRVSVRNVVVQLDPPPVVAARPITVVLRQLEMPARPDDADVLVAHFEGTAFAGLTESFSGTLQVDPLDHHIELALNVGGVKRDFEVPGFGAVHAGARGIHVEARARQDTMGNWPLEIEANAREFVLREDRAGGEEWREKDAAIAARATLSADARSLDALRISATASQLDMRLTGEVVIDAGRLPGRVALEVRQLPAPLLALGQRLARSEGIDVVALPKAMLRLDLRAAGDLAMPETTNPAGSLEMRGWQVVSPHIAQPVGIDMLRATITPEVLAIERLDVAMGELRGGGSALVPLLTDDDAPATATLSVAVRGPATSIVEVARSLDVMPREVETINAPLAIRVAAEALLEPVPGVAFLPRFEGAAPRVSANLTWGEGTVALRDVAGTITLAPGSLAYRDGNARLSNLNARLGDLQLNVDATLRAMAPWETAPTKGAALEGSVIAQGPVKEALALVAGRLALPMARDDIDGDVRIEIAGTMALDNPAEARYNARLSMTDGRLMVRTADATFPVDRLQIDVGADPEIARLHKLEARIAQMATLHASGEATRARIVLDFEVDGAIKVAEVVAPYDLSEMVVDGQARGKGSARVLANKPLPATGHMVGDWAAALGDPEAYRFSARDDADLRLDLDAQLFPGEGATVFHRDLPWPITNIRGDVRADETGFQFHGVRASFGNSHDVNITSGRVKLGHMGLPVEIEFAADIPEIDTNDWFEGWGTRPWAERPFTGVRTPRPKQPPASLIMTTIRADLAMASTRFLSVRGNDARVHFEYDVWRGRHNELRVRVPNARVYGGRIYDLAATLVFPKGRNAPEIDAIGYAENVQMRDFLTDLRKRPDPFVGLFTGHATLKGVLTDKATWTGEGVYTITDSRFLGEQALVVLATAMNLGRDASTAPTTWNGTASWKDRKVSFPDMEISNSQIRIRATGVIDFKGALDFLVTVQLLGNRLEGIWLLGRVAPLVNNLTDFLVSMRLRGTLWEPTVMTVPLNLDQAIFFRDMIPRRRESPRP